MCTSCGCAEHAHPTVTVFQDGKPVRIENHAPHTHSHAHAHHAHSHEHESATTIPLEADILAKNDLLAQRNRGWFEGRNILALNLVSSPGSGKTTVLEKTILQLAGDIPIHVIGGDQATTNDAERIQATGCQVAQINTGAGCHLKCPAI